MFVMTTITIDQPIKFNKTHFEDPLEAAHFLLRWTIKQAKSQQISTKIPKKSQYQIAKEDLANGINTISLESYMTKRWLTI